MRHEDESVVELEASGWARCSLDGLFILKCRGFGERTRSFRTLIFACILVDVLGSAIGLPPAVLVAALVLAVLGVAALTCVKVGDLTTAASKVQARREPRRPDDDDPPFVQYT